MPFQPGNKLAVGGNRDTAGRKPKSITTQQKILAEIGMAFIRKHAMPGLEAYLTLVNEHDPATVRHFIDRFLPAVQKIDLDIKGNLGKRVFNFILPEAKSEPVESKARAGFTFSVDGEIE